MIEILTSNQDDFGYYNNLGYLKEHLRRGDVNFVGQVANHAPNQFVFHKARIYDFTRSASSTIREDMTNFLSNVLPGLQEVDLQRIQEALGCHFNYYSYKGYLDQVNNQRSESMYMLIFNQQGQYVAHVSFISNSLRANQQQFTVNATLTCQRFTYFPKQDTDFDAVLQALQNVHVNE